MNEKVEMTKKQFVGWIFSSLMLATLIRLIVKAILDVDSAIVYVSGIINREFEKLSPKQTRLLWILVFICVLCWMIVLLPGALAPFN